MRRPQCGVELMASGNLVPKSPRTRYPWRPELPGYGAYSISGRSLAAARHIGHGLKKKGIWRNIRYPTTTLVEVFKRDVRQPSLVRSITRCIMTIS